jgi:hypothetical protein
MGRTMFSLLLAFLLLSPGYADVAAPTRVLIVSGLGGEQSYETAFQELAQSAADQLRDAGLDVTLLVGESATSAAVEQVIAEQAADGVFVLIYIGHGTFDGETFRFNVIGRDFTAGKLAGWLGDSSRQLIVVTGSASGAIHDALAAPGRSVLTATRNGNERNLTVFPRFFVEALSSNAADTDKDLNVTATEAFAYAEAKVNDYYDQNNRIVTEHPRSTGEPAALVLARLQSPSASMVGQADDARLKDLENRIAELRASKSSMSLEQYFDELQRLLLQLAEEELNLASPLDKEIDKEIDKEVDREGQDATEEDYSERLWQPTQIEQRDSGAGLGLPELLPRFELNLPELPALDGLEESPDGTP